jgi:uncharacterized phage-like protein YoqJ
MKEMSCAFTGHRPQKFPWRYDESDKRCTALKAALDAEIEKLIAEGIASFFSGMAEGVGQWAALSVLARRESNPAIKLNCILPWKGQADEWSQASQKRYQEILRQADAVTYVGRDYQKDCLLKRNRHLVDSAAVLLAVYNGEWRGGTAATVRYAQKAGRKIIQIEPLTLKITYL